MTTTHLNTPWTLAFERDGTEDLAVIRDASGEDLATSRPFWLPAGGEPTPPTLAAMRLMLAAPKLVEALESILLIEAHRTEGCNVGNAAALNELLRDIAGTARAAISNATAGAAEGHASAATAQG